MAKSDYQPYNPAQTEPEIYAAWEKGGYFTPKVDPTKKPFVVTLPPPNVTGGLHAGHAMYVVEDILVRYHRMLGEPTLWLPGFDHASIAVEYLVSKQLAKAGKTKKEAGREEYLRRAKEFAEESREYIRQQLKKTGFSLDWTREAYTMDEVRSRAVEEAFNRLYKKGLIYKGHYLVNWCLRCQTAISDLENEHEEEKGKLYFIQYGPITIATTRPETMFADVAVAVHPQDERYQKLVGQKVPLPLTSRKIPVIADAAVDREFGTGALKITPAHDETDWEIGQRHQLEPLVGIDTFGKLTALAGEFANLLVVEARQRVIEALEAQGLLVKVEEITHSLGHCQRCGAVTEPLISEQWFVKTKPLAEAAIKAVKTGQIKIIPKRFEKTYFHWLENIRDWCISRQLWWGHKIPLAGEEDVLDTWFSSGLWPISVFGWPQQTEDFKYFYPTTVRETGYDILFFWVAREIMMCLAMTNQVPFKVVYLHGLVRDEKGRKFSKTAGIGFDPLTMIERYGADALRMALIVGNAPGNDLKLGEEKIKGYRNFANKIWNASRFVSSALEKEGGLESLTGIDPRSSGLEEDKGILKELEEVTTNVTNSLENYRLSDAASSLYEFFWHRYCDGYIEVVKPRLRSEDPTVRQQVLAVLVKVLKTSMLLLHPFMPFVTEMVWGKLGEPEPLIVTTWPKNS